MRKLLLALLFVICLPVASCAAAIAALPAVIAAVTDAVMVLDQIQDHADAYFIIAPDTKRQELVNAAVDKARGALNVALRTAQGADSLGTLDQKKVDEAFDDFKKAYQELLVLVGPLGVHGGPPSSTLAASPGSLQVPEPLALSLKVQ